MAKSSKKPIKAKTQKKKALKVNWLAEGYHTLNPFLIVKNPAAALKFYQKAFGFTTKQVMHGPDKTIMHAEMLHEGSTIMMGGENTEQKMFNPAHYGGTSVVFYLYTKDVDALCKKASKAGAKCLQKPQEMYWGDRVCMFTCPDGYLWWFATHVKEVAPEDMHP